MCVCVCALQLSLSVFLSLTEGRLIDPLETPHKTKDKCSKHWQDPKKPKKPKFHVEWALALVLSTHNFGFFGFFGSCQGFVHLSLVLFGYWYTPFMLRVVRGSEPKRQRGIRQISQGVLQHGFRTVAFLQGLRSPEKPNFHRSL